MRTHVKRYSKNVSVKSPIIPTHEGFLKPNGDYSERARNIFRIWNEYEHDLAKPHITREGLDMDIRGGSNEIFAEWFINTFPQNEDPHYIREWVARFHAGTPTVHMDKNAREKYFLIVKKWHGG